MIKYYVEMYNVYYPSGGLNDVEGPFDTFEDAHVLYSEERSHQDCIRIFRIIDSVIDVNWSYP